MLEINLIALDSWSKQRKTCALLCITCIALALSYFSLVTSPLQQLQQQRSLNAKEIQRIQAQHQTLVRENQRLTKLDDKLPANQLNLPPLKALRHCAITEFNWQQLFTSATGQGRPLYSITLALQYTQAICLLNALAQHPREGYLQKMLLSHQDEQPTLMMQLEMVHQEGCG